MISSYWECKTHECGSTKFNNLSRHEWEACTIVKKNGEPPKNTWHNSTIGGLNGDVSRKFYKDWDKLCLERQQREQKKQNWIKQYGAHEMSVEKVEMRRAGRLG